MRSDIHVVGIINNQLEQNKTVQYIYLYGSWFLLGVLQRRGRFFPTDIILSLIWHTVKKNLTVVGK